jgi:adenylyltransferase and sulfurtransferase
VVGVMGVLQALEALKLIVGGGLEDGRKEEEEKTPMMLLFSAMSDVPFRSVRMRGKRKDCFACADEGGLTLDEMQSSMDYVQFCGVRQPVQLLGPEERISVQKFSQITQGSEKHVLLDVREKEHFDLSSLAGSINVPISRFMSHRSGDLPEWIPEEVKSDTPIYVICRVGNDSQIAAQKLKDMGLGLGGERFIGDIEGGLKAWKDGIDPTLPLV